LTAYAVRSTSCSSKLVGTALKRTRCLRTGCWRCDTPPLVGCCRATLVARWLPLKTNLLRGRGSSLATQVANKLLEMEASE
jgi:hypothetical protein